jgi:uncharacterized protein YsxB (DUF464 family)
MISIGVILDEERLLISSDVSGHAIAGPPGFDVVCSAVSILARTAFRVLSEHEGIMLRGGAPERGNFRMETGYSGSGKEFLAAISAFLLDGFESVSGMYPEFVTLNIKTKWRN